MVLGNVGTSHLYIDNRIISHAPRIFAPCCDVRLLLTYKKTKMVKDQKINDYCEYIKTYSAIIASCDELLTALDTHTGKLVDNRFFKKHFTISNEYRDWTKYSFYGKQYDWDTYNYSIYLGAGNNGERLLLQTRETGELVFALQEKKLNSLSMVEKYTAEIEKLQLFDESALIADLLAVYKKHNKPEVWGKVLESYDVKYPS